MNFLKLSSSVTEEGSEEFDGLKKAGDSNLRKAGDSNAISVGGRLKPRDIADFINQELRSPSSEHRKSGLAEPPSKSNAAKKSPTLPANTMHPHRVWSRTANGGLQYTGMLSSDC